MTKHYKVLRTLYIMLKVLEIYLLYIKEKYTFICIWNPSKQAFKNKVKNSLLHSLWTYNTYIISFKILKIWKKIKICVSSENIKITNMYLIRNIIFMLLLLKI